MYMYGIVDVSGLGFSGLRFRDRSGFWVQGLGFELRSPVLVV